MHSSTPTIRSRAKPKPPSAEQQQQHQQIGALTSRWELSAVAKGSRDSAACSAAAKTLQHLVHYLVQHKSTCKHKATRVLLQQQLPPELLLALLASGQDEVVGGTLHAAHGLASFAPAVVPAEAAPRLVQLLCHQSHGAVAAGVLTTQLSHWRFSQIWPHWLAQGATDRVFEHLQQLVTHAEAAAVSGSTPASRAADGCVGLLTLLSKLVALSEQQVLAQIAPDARAAGRWLLLLSRISRLHSSLAGSHVSLHLQDSCCALLAGMAAAPATSLALLHSAPLRQDTLRLLHAVLRRPCCVQEADDSHIRCWMHAAAACSLPVLWQQHQRPQQQQPQQQSASALAPHEEQQLLADIAVAAAATLCNECFSTSLVARQVDGAAAHLLAAALLPGDVVYGSHRSCTSRFMAAVLGSNCCHVLLHALAASTNTSSEQAALLAAAAAAAVTSATQASAPAGSRPATPGQHDGGAEHPARSSIVLAPVQQELQPGWLLLRMISAQCAAVADSNSEAAAAWAMRCAGTQPATAGSASLVGSNGDSMHRPPTHVRQQVALLQGANSTAAAGSAVRPEQVLRVVQAYSSHITTGSDAQAVPGLLRSLHFLMCQAVLVLRHRRVSQQQQDSAEQHALQQQDKESRHWERLQWLSLTVDGASSSSSVEDAEVGGGGQQLLASATAVLHLIHRGQEPSQSAAAGTALASNSTSSRSGDKGSSGSAHQLSWSLTASVYVALAIAVHLQERALSTHASHQEHLSASDSCLTLAGVQLAAAALKLLLPVVVPLPQQQAAQAAYTSTAAAAPPGTAAAAAVNPPQQQAPSLVLPVYEALESSLAAVQALATLAAVLQPALPELLSQCLSSSSGYLGRQQCATPSSREGSTPVKLPAARAAIAAAAAALDDDLCKLLSQAVLCWQGSHAAQPGGCVLSDKGADVRASSSRATHAARLQLSVQSGLQQHLWEELRCLSAAALASCYGQLGAPTPQGAVLGPFREHGSPFTDAQLQLGAGQQLSVHAAVLAAGCPVLRQQLVSAAAAAAGQANGCSGSHGRSSGSTLVLKLSAAVDYQALQQALDFVYTGAAVLPHAGLASQLHVSSSCLDAARKQQGRGQLSEQRLTVLPRHQVQELHEQQQTARQQLHKLGMLTRKLQLPLLAALTRGNRPQPGQRLPDLHLSFAALLPHQVVLSGGCTAAAPDGSCACQQHSCQDKQESSVSVGQQGSERVHPSSTEYLDLLAACTAADHATAAFGNDAAGPAAGQPSNVAAVSSGLQPPLSLLTGLAGGSPEACFADVYMAAPATLVHTPGSHSAAASTLLQQAAGSGSSTSGQGGVVYAFLPAHRVILSGCCPYFEALLSDRWHHEEQQLPHEQTQHSTPGQQAPAGARVVLVPEADIHVAAALQHYLYTNSLKVQLPAETAMAGTAGTATGVRASTGSVIRLSGCCAVCHTARTLLRLWRCAELLLLPQLQALCLAGIEAAARQLDTRCCLVLLADCCHLGVPAAADGVLAVLMQTADRGAAAAVPEWSELPPGLQAALVKAWADRRLQQQEDGVAEVGAHTAAQASVAALPAGCQLVTAGGSTLQHGGGVCCGAVAGHEVDGPGLLTRQYMLPSEAAVVPRQHVQGLRDAVRDLGDLVGMQ